MEIIKEIKRIDPQTYILEPTKLYELVHNPNKLRAKVILTQNYLKDKLGLESEFVGGFTLTAKSEYGLKRMWNTWFSIREFVQNALDTDRFSGMKNIGNDIVIADMGPGVKPSYVIFFGAGEKKCWQRGAFGEGMKIAMIYLESQNMPTIVVTKFEGLNYPLAYRMVLVDNLPIFLVFRVWGDSPLLRNPTFTMVYIIDSFEEYRASLQQYNIPNTDLAFFDEKKIKSLSGKIYNEIDEIMKCPHPMNQYIVYFKDELYRKILWVRDIFVNMLDKITYKKKYFFSYNLWWVNLDPNRVTVSSEDMWKMRGITKTLVQKFAPQIEELKDEVSKLWVIKKDVVGGRYTFYTVTDELLEEYAEYDYFTPDFLADTIIKRLKDEGIFVHAVGSNLSYDIMVEGGHELGLPSYLVVDNPEIAKKIMEKLGIPDFMEMLINSKMESMEEDVVDYKEAPYLKGYHDLLLELANFIMKKRDIENVRDIKFIKGRSFYDPSTKVIYLDSTSIIEAFKSSLSGLRLYYAFMDVYRAFVHELAHHVAESLFGKGRDLTEEHVRGFELLGTMFSMYGDVVFTVSETLSGRIHLTYLLGTDVKNFGVVAEEILKFPLSLLLESRLVIGGESDEDIALITLYMTKQMLQSIDYIDILDIERSPTHCFKLIRTTFRPKLKNDYMVLPFLLNIYKSSTDKDRKIQLMKLVVDSAKKCKDAFTYKIMDLDNFILTMNSIPKIKIHELELDEIVNDVYGLYKFMKENGMETKIY